MSFEISIPRLGWSMEEGTFVRWLKKDGDRIQAGDAVFELEGEKAAQDIEAVDAGILRIPPNAPQPGTIVAVGAVIGFLVAEGEATPELGQRPATPAASKTAATSLTSTVAPAEISKQAVVPRPAELQPAPAAAPSVRRMARERGVSLAAVAGSGPAGRIMADDVRTVKSEVGSRPIAAHSGRTLKTQTSVGQVRSTVASPRARRVASELGLDWQSVAGTGRDGRVRERDIRKLATKPQTDVGVTTVAVSSRRRTIANRMQASRDRTVPVTLTTRIDATNLVSLRNQFRQATQGTMATIPSYSDIIMKLVSLVLPDHPLLSIREEGDQWVTPSSAEGLHLGLAVDTDEGLVVPVVHAAGVMSLVELTQRTRELIQKSRTGKLSLAEMQGAVFTITNLGAFGIDGFSPIINLPETAVLGLGRIRAEAAVLDDKIVARDQMTLSLTFDHRIVDGAPAARFLQSVGGAIENPSAWLLRGV